MDLVTTKCLFSRMNIMRSTLLASMLLRRLPIRWASADKLRSAWQLFWMWVVMPDVPIPLLLPSHGVHFMNELQAVASTFLTKHATFLSLMVGVNLLTNQHQAVNSLLP